MEAGQGKTRVPRELPTCRARLLRRTFGPINQKFWVKNIGKFIDIGTWQRN
jgi:hypothetical protein